MRETLVVMLNRELHSNENTENQSPLNHSLSVFLQERVLTSFKGSPREMRGNMNSLIGLVCFMLPRIIGMVDGLDPCLN